ncbi:hypothetical protein GCM10010439_56450 [Actinocorallia aurantiaca]|uniref:N-acetyltransferase domain-containing protein n=1 Tax=Actinocorallia aurantiaca TaxID=46204 RepID=A0ABN3UJZ3_9ACTN
MIRPYRADDLEGVRAMSDRLSSASLYQRFFVGTPRLPDSYLRSLSTVDHRGRVVLLAVSAAGVHAIAEYIRDAADPATSELAFLVTDPWQRRGLSRPLLMRLATIAASAGVTRFRADVLPENSAARAAIRRYHPGSTFTRLPDSLYRYEFPPLDHRDHEDPRGREAAPQGRTPGPRPFWPKTTDPLTSGRWSRGGQLFLKGLKVRPAR